MLGRILHWIYCLPLDQAALLALAATGAFLWLRRRYESRRWWRAGLLALLACWAVVVLIQTFLRDRTAGNGQLSLIPFQCYITVLGGGEKELIRSAFMNLLLFYPGGLIGRSLWRRPGRLLIILLTASLVIETAQYALGLGVAETDDVIHNGLGALLGILAVRQYEKNTQKTGAT